MKLYSHFLVLIIGCLIVSCTNSPQQQTELSIPEVTPLHKAFKNAIILQDSCDRVTDSDKRLILFRQVFYFFKTDIVKKHIIQEKSQVYFNKLIKLTDNIRASVNVKYEKGIYTYVLHNIDDVKVMLTYIPDKDQFTVDLTVRGRTVLYNGKIDYNTEGWEVRFPKDEFNDDITSKPFLYYALYNDEGLVPYKPICINIIPFKLDVGVVMSCVLCTNKLGYESSNIAKILIKDNISGKIYNITFDKLYNETHSGFRYADVGVIMYNDTLWDFISIIRDLSDYTISFINEDGKNAVIKNPENLCNIHDAVDKFIEDYKIYDYEE